MPSLLSSFEYALVDVGVQGGGIQNVHKVPGV